MVCTSEYMGSNAFWPDASVTTQCTPLEKRRGRERERERHTHTHRERGRDGEKDRGENEMDILTPKKNNQCSHFR